MFGTCMLGWPFDALLTPKFGQITTIALTLLGTPDKNPTQTEDPVQEKKSRISLDWWTVIIAFGIVALVLVGALPTIPW
jgi:hypothetical protein